MRIKHYFLIAAVAIVTGFAAQNPVTYGRSCGTQPDAAWDSWFNQKVSEYQQDKALGKLKPVNHVIPVVVHVIHGGQNKGSYPNISQAQINSQIAILNNDYAGAGLNANLVPSAFAGVKANTGITFCLAGLDPNGVALQEPGIDRVDYHSIPGGTNPGLQTSISGFMSLMDNNIKPATIWDPTRYFNLWVSDINSATTLLGYATFPAGSGLAGTLSGGTASTDGVFVGAQFLGNTGAATYPFNKGRTATHEAGHWLGLRHIDGDANCGNDYCNDTPVQQALNNGCPSYPKVSCTNSPNGEMFMNFMDYCDDACLSMFTNDQNTRMQTAMANSPFRKQLTASSATMCNLSPVIPTSDFNILPEICMDSVMLANNLSSGTPGPIYSWSIVPTTGASLSPNAAAANPTIHFTLPGTYTVTLVASNSAGYNTSASAINVIDCGDEVGINESFLSHPVTVAPNPSSGIFNVTASLPLTKELCLQVHDCVGQLIYSDSSHDVTRNNFSVDLSGFAGGVYILTLSDGTGIAVKRLILNK
jgi:hypothetical protein